MEGGGRITVQLVSSLTRLDLNKNENMLLLYLCSEAVESKFVKQETSRHRYSDTSPTVSVLCLSYSGTPTTLLKFLKMGQRRTLFRLFSNKQYNSYNKSM